MGQSKLSVCKANHTISVTISAPAAWVIALLRDHAWLPYTASLLQKSQNLGRLGFQICSGRPSYGLMRQRRSVRTTLAQLRSGHCRLLNSYNLQGPHQQRHIRCLSGVWSGTTLRRASVQLSKPSDATYLWDNPAEVADFLNLDNWQ